MKIFTEKPLRQIKKYKIRTQLSVIFIVAVFIPLVLIGTLLIGSTRRLLQQYYSDMLAADNQRLGTAVSEISVQAYSISNEIVHNKELAKLTKYQYYIPDNYNKDREKVTVFEDVSSYPGISNISVYTDNKHFYESPSIIIADDEISRSDWFTRATKSKEDFWTCIEDINGKKQFCLVRDISVDDSDNKVVMVITIDEDYLSQRMNLGEKDSAILVLDDLNVVYETDDDSNISPSELIKITDSDNSQGNMQKLDKVALYNTASFIYIISYSNNALRTINLITVVMLLIVVLASGLSTLLVSLFNNYFTSRMGDFRNAIHQASNDEYDLSTYELLGGDEVSEAFDDLKLMIEKIKQKDAEMYETVLRQSELDKRQQEMEFEMLASKINPHFLYNTLESIRMKAFTNGDREVASAIKLLGKSMRYVLENTGTQYTSLNKELEHVKVYLDIQSIRFENKFSSQINIEEGIEPAEIQILPLLLQPIVENAITHGLEEVEEGGLIQIDIYAVDDKYCIDVYDNGIGIDEEELLRLRSEIENKDLVRNKSIGLHNINQRLILTYGEEASLRIVSRKGEGTHVKFYIPNP